MTDEKSSRKAVVISLKVIENYRGDWEDLEDAIIAACRRDEPKVSWGEAKKKLKISGKL